MKDNDKLDIIYRNVMLVTGATTAILFILSLFSAIKFPGAFTYLVIGMISFAVLFLILRTIHRFRDSFKIKPKK
jgi:hypothetical protein